MSNKPLSPEVDLRTLPPEQMLRELVLRLQDKAQEWAEFNSDEFCYEEEEAAYANGQDRAYEQAADDLNWILRAFGLERK